MTNLSDLSTDQIKAAFAQAGMASAAQMHGNVYNQVRAGLINEAVGTLKAGCSTRSHKDARKALRKALREFGVTI